MTNIAKLIGIGQEFLIKDNKEVIAEFVDGNLSNKYPRGNSDDTVSLHEQDCSCNNCGYKIEME